MALVSTEYRNRCCPRLPQGSPRTRRNWPRWLVTASPYPRRKARSSEVEQKEVTHFGKARDCVFPRRSVSQAFFEARVGKNSHSPDSLANRELLSVVAEFFPFLKVLLDFLSGYLGLDLWKGMRWVCRVSISLSNSFKTIFSYTSWRCFIQELEWKRSWRVFEEACKVFKSQ